MIPIDEARAVVLDGLEPLEVVAVDLPEACGAVLGESVRAMEAVPAFANSAMDGVALRAADAAAPSARLRVAGVVAAGSPGAVEVEPGRCVRIMTGAPIPRGADAVQMVERVRFEVDEAGEWAVVEGPVSPGAAIRPAGDDLAAGAVALERGTVISPAALGVLATLGCVQVPIVRPVRVGILSTGDELVDPGTRPGFGQIVDSNRPMLRSLVMAAGAVPVDLGRVADDESAVEAALFDAVRGCDLLLTSGGVSMGDFDPIKAVLLRCAGESARWMQVAVRPAKPLMSARLEGVPVIGLPGNPVSSLVAFELYARPAIRRLAGFAEVLRPEVVLPVVTGVRRRADGKVHALRVRWVVQGGVVTGVEPVGAQGSHQLAATATATALAWIPNGDSLAPGTPVAVTPLD